MTQSTEDFLLEIGTAELPAKSQKHLAQSLCALFCAVLKEAELTYSHSHFFVTPRRIAIKVDALSTQQPDKLVEKFGPPEHQAFDAHRQPTPAALGFARSCGVGFEALSTRNTPKGNCLYFSQIQPGQSTATLLPELLQKTLKQFALPKAMRWGEGSISFIRPIVWTLALLGRQFLDCEILGTRTIHHSFGHRFHHPEAVHFAEPKAYAAALRRAFVIVDFDERQKYLEEEIQKAAKQHQGRVLWDEALCAENTGLVEWPVVLTVPLDPTLLDIPKEPLISAMQHHQKAFALEDVSGRLLPNFLIVSNIESANPAQVIAGNQRVMQARLRDAAFFYAADCAHSPEIFLEKLKHVVFQKQLGTLFDKASRLETLASFLANALHIDPKPAARAALLAKFDLVTDMVKEFPELQGIMGSYYAQVAEEPVEVTQAIRDHYAPRFAGDALPSTPFGQIVALADKLDTLIGIFGVGQRPTGDKDPFALRRAANGIVRIMLEQKLTMDLSATIHFGRSLFQTTLAEDTAFAVQHFVLDRALSWYEEQGGQKDEWLAAVTAATKNSENICILYDIWLRALALQSFRQLPACEALVSANKRVKNLLSKSTQTTSTQESNFDEGLCELEAERTLFHAINKVQEQFTKLQRNAYAEKLDQLATLRPTIDQFFEEVMVMVDDEKTRQNRLALLANTRQLFLEIADLSLLSPSSAG